MSGPHPRSRGASGSSSRTRTGTSVSGGGGGSGLEGSPGTRAGSILWDNLLSEEALVGLEGELLSIINIPTESWDGSRWDKFRAWLLSTLDHARDMDDMPAKRRLKALILQSIAKVHGNARLWRHLNLLRSNVEEAVRSRPASEKVQKALQSLGISQKVIVEALQNAHGDISTTTANLAKSDAHDQDEASSTRTFGPRELRRLSHDSLWLLVQSACSLSRTELKLLYVCLSKAHELYADGQGVLSLEAYHRIKVGAVSGLVRDALAVLKVAHRTVYANGGVSPSRAEGGECKQVAPSKEVEEGKAWSSSNDGQHFCWEAKADVSDFALGTETVESHFRCPLSGETMHDPVTLPCQHTFSKMSLIRHFEGTPEENHVCPQCRGQVPPGQLSINRALAETMARYFPLDVEGSESSVLSPGTSDELSKIDQRPLDALKNLGFSQAKISSALKRHNNNAAEVVMFMLLDTNLVPRQITWPDGGLPVTHTDLRRLNMDSVSWLIDTLLASKAGNTIGRKKAFELLCRIDAINASLSRGMRQRMQHAVLKGDTNAVEEVLRALGVDEVANEVDAELALTDHLTGIVLVDPVTLGCGHAFSRAALLEHLNKLQVHRTCPLCRWEVPANFELKVDPLLSYVLARTCEDKVKNDLDSLQSALSTAPLVVQLLCSYQNNSEILLKAMEVIAGWAAEGPSNRAILQYVGVLPPLLSTLHRHRSHEQLAVQTLRTLVTMAQEDCSALQLGRMRGLTILGDLIESLDALPWDHHVKAEVEDTIVQLLRRLLGVPGAKALQDNSSHLSTSAAASSTSSIESEEGVRLQLALAFERALDRQQDSVLELLGLLNTVAPSCWFNSDSFKVIYRVIVREMSKGDAPVTSDYRAWSLLKKFLEKALDGSAEVADLGLALNLSTTSSLDLLSQVVGKGIPAEKAKEEAPNQNVLFVKNSACTLDDTSMTMSGTFGGGAGGALGFGGWGLGPCITEGQQVAWDMTLVREEHQDMNPEWVSEEHILLGFVTSATFRPDWTFYLTEDNPFLGINCSTGDVRLQGRGVMTYPRISPGDTLRIGVDLRGPVHHFLLEKLSGDSDRGRTLVRYPLPNSVRQVYPAAIIFNRLDFTDRKYSAEVTIRPVPANFSFSAWSAKAEARNRERVPSSSRSSSVPPGTRPAKWMGIHETKSFCRIQNDEIARTSRLGETWQYCGTREVVENHGDHTWVFRPKGHGHHVVGLTTGTGGCYPPIARPVLFQIEYYDTGLLRVVGLSGPIHEEHLVAYTSRDDNEVRVTVSVDERWVQPGLAPMTVSIAKGSGDPVWQRTFQALDGQREVRAFVGMVQEGDSVACSYSFKSLAAETQMRWLVSCISALRTLGGIAPESPGRGPKLLDTSIGSYFAVLRHMTNHSMPAPEEEVLQLLQDLVEGIDRVTDWTSPDYWVLFHILDRYNTLLLTPRKGDSTEEKEQSSILVLQSMVWDAAEAIIMASINRGGDWWRTCLLVDAGLFMYAKEALQTVRGGVDTANTRLILRLASIFLLVANHGNAYHHEAIAQSLCNLILAIQPPSPTDKAHTEAQKLVLQVFLALVQATSTQPATARQSLLNQPNVHLLLGPLKERLAQKADLDAVLPALTGLLSCADEVAWEMVLYEPSAARQPRYISRLSTPSRDALDETVEPETKSVVTKCVTAGATDPYLWLALPTPLSFGPWKPERWEEGLYAALIQGDEQGALTILSYGDRSSTIFIRPCLVTRRGPWSDRVRAGTMSIPCTVMEAVEALAKDMPHLRARLNAMADKMRVLHLISTTGPCGRSPRKTHKLPRGGLIEKADHHMAVFDVREEACRLRYGFFPGDRVRSRRFLAGYGTVVGQLDGRLWISWDEDSGASMRWDDWRFVDLELVDEIEAPLKRVPSLPGLWPTIPSMYLISPEEEAESAFPSISVGSKVTRGPMWARSDEDGFAGNIGLVQRVEGEQVTVRWHGSCLNRNYRYSTSRTGNHELALAPSFLPEVLIGVNSECRVTRGPDWRFGDQDGGLGGLGQLMYKKGNFVVVRWLSDPAHQSDEGLDEGKEVERDETRRSEEKKSEPEEGKAERNRPSRLYGYWCNAGYSEVEPFIRGNIKISLLDDVKADRLVHKDEALNCLSLLIDKGGPGSARQAMLVIANLAATGLPSLAYELVVKWKVQEIVYSTLERNPDLLDAAGCALVALFTAGRPPTKKTLLADERFLGRLMDCLMIPGAIAARAYGIVGLLEVTHEMDPTKLAKALDVVMGGKPEEYSLLGNNVLEALEPTVCPDVHVLHAASNLLMYLMISYPPFLQQFKTMVDRLADRVEKLMAYPEVSASWGRMLSFLLQEVGLKKDHPCFTRIVNSVQQTSLLRELGPFSLLRMDHWSSETLQRILEASKEVIMACGNEDEVIELLVRDSVLDLYVELVERFSRDPHGTSSGAVVAAVLQCIGAAFDATSTAREIIIDGDMARRLRELLDTFRRDSRVLATIFNLFEKVTRPTIPSGAPGGEYSPGILSGDMVEVSTGGRNKGHLTDSRQNSYWESSSRVRFEGQVRGIKPDGLVDIVGRTAGPGSHGTSPVEGHWITVRLPAPDQWEKLQIYRGNMESYTPEDLAVLAFQSEEDLLLLERHYMSSRTSSQYETILQKRDLVDTLERAGLPVGQVSVRVEIYKMLQNGHNCRVCGLRLVGVGRQFDGLDEDTIMNTLREFVGDARTLLPQALLVLDRLTDERAFRLLSCREDRASRDESLPRGLHPHVGSLVQCKWSRNGQLHPAIITGRYDNQTFDVHYHDGDRDFGMPLEALEAMRDQGRSRIHLQSIIMAAQQGVPNYFDLKRDERNRVLHSGPPPPISSSSRGLSLGPRPPPPMRLPPEVAPTQRFDPPPRDRERADRPSRLSFDEEVVATTARHLIAALAASDDGDTHQGVEELLRQRSDLRDAVVRAEQLLTDTQDPERRALLEHNLSSLEQRRHALQQRIADLIRLMGGSATGSDSPPSLPLTPESD